MKLRMRRLFLAGLSCFLICVSSANAAQRVREVGSRWKRVSTDPTITLLALSWSRRNLQSAVIRQGKKIVMLYRAQDADGTSRLGYASSNDGLHFTHRAEPVLSPEMAYEENGGVEDPRLIKIGKTFYLTYTGYNKKDAQLC